LFSSNFLLNQKGGWDEERILKIVGDFGTFGVCMDGRLHY